MGIVAREKEKATKNKKKRGDLQNFRKRKDEGRQEQQIDRDEEGRDRVSMGYVPKEKQESSLTASDSVEFDGDGSWSPSVNFKMCFQE